VAETSVGVVPGKLMRTGRRKPCKLRDVGVEQASVVGVRSAVRFDSDLQLLRAKIVEDRVSCEVRVKSEDLEANRVQLRNDVFLGLQQSQMMVSGGLTGVCVGGESASGAFNLLCLLEMQVACQDSPREQASNTRAACLSYKVLQSITPLMEVLGAT
jgi:hypothetical protein